MNDPQINPTAREWRIVEAWAVKRLIEHRQVLEAMNTDDKRTTELRARIAELKALLALAEPPKPPRMINQLTEWDGGMSA